LAHDDSFQNIMGFYVGDYTLKVSDGLKSAF